MYSETAPVLIHNLKTLGNILTIAEKHCAERKIEPDVMLSQRLFPDMFALTRQVQLVCDFAMRCGARLTGQPVPSNPDTEKTFDELQARIQKAVTYLSDLPKADFEGAGGRQITMKTGGKDVTLSGHDYFHTFLLPNFYFHMTTAYNILRHNGVTLGKGDFMGR